MSGPKIVLVRRKTRLEDLVERFNTREQARFYIEHSGGDFNLYLQEHEVYYAALLALSHALRSLAKLQEIERGFLPNYLFAPDDIVVTIGIDGLVVNTAKYLDGQPLVAVNPDPEHIDGLLLPFNVQQAAPAVRQALNGQAPIRLVTMAQASLHDGQRLLAFNDLFIGVRSHISARYAIRHGDRRERHSSSGVIVSTGVGATGWLSSLFNMAEGMCAHFMPAPVHLERPSLAWDTQQLVFVVREPFVSKTSQAEVVCGRITPGSPLVLESHMPSGGVIFSDGVEADYLEFNAGAVAQIGLAERQAKLVGK